jgi:hypothetical protein
MTDWAFTTDSLGLDNATSTELELVLQGLTGDCDGHYLHINVSELGRHCKRESSLAYAQVQCPSLL